MLGRVAPIVVEGAVNRGVERGVLGDHGIYCLQLGLGALGIQQRAQRVSTGFDRELVSLRTQRVWIVAAIQIREVRWAVHRFVELVFGVFGEIENHPDFQRGFGIAIAMGEAVLQGMNGVRGVQLERRHLHLHLAADRQAHFDFLALAGVGQAVFAERGDGGAQLLADVALTVC